MDPEDYLSYAGLTRPGMGGQELILYEILALLAPCYRVWLPFPKGCVTLGEHLEAHGHVVIRGRRKPVGQSIEGVYFGTPTIVDGRPLFPGAPHGVRTKEQERDVVRAIVDEATVAGAQRIVSGLGSGDISVAERKADMGRGTKVVATKVFDEFTDWVLVKEVK